MKHFFYISCLISLLTSQAYGADQTATDGDATINTPSAVPVSFDEVVEWVRHQHKSWQILDARSKHKESGLRYRFKLINGNGQVRIILIDPRNPNLGNLEQ